MWVVPVVVGAISLFSVSSASPVQYPQPRPLVLWHGLGDSYGSPGILEFIELMKGVHPGLFVHSVHLADSQEDDKKAAFVREHLLSLNLNPNVTTVPPQFGNVNEQIANVSQQLGEITELRNGFDAIGFSQGMWAILSLF